MNTQHNPATHRWPPIEEALRYLGTRNHGPLVDFLAHAIDRPDSQAGQDLAPLVDPTRTLHDWTTRQRAQAVWRIIEEGVRDPDVSLNQSRPRRALNAAFRLPDPEVRRPWGSSLAQRFRQLHSHTAVFRQAKTNQPIDAAWKEGVTKLGQHLSRRFNELRSTAQWEPYGYPVHHAESAGPTGLLSYHPTDESLRALRKPTGLPQPIFVELFVTTLFMKKQSVYRRITERIVTAQEDGIEFYKARGFSVGRTSKRTYVPVDALWGCEARPKPATRPNGPIITELWFPSPLSKGQSAYFASEAIFNPVGTEDDERDWINVGIDHHGIAQGRLRYGDLLPVRGLTIRVRFDESCRPDAVWWYAELNEEERLVMPPEDDEHRLTIVGDVVQKTFTEQPCQPHGNYGISFSWPADPVD